MKLHIPKSCAQLATLVVAFSCAASIHASTIPATAQTLAGSGEDNQYQFVRRGPEQDMLREAYDILARADHDYKGHRAKAMKEIEGAGNLLGMNLKGEGHGRERQAVSDEQLRHAREVLESAGNNVTGQKKVHARIEAAIKQVNIALGIK